MRNGNTLTTGPLRFSHNRELIIDSFAGGGGASLGIELALGVPVDVAINHDPEAVEMHKANHPRTQHFSQHIYSVDPLDATGGRPVALLWASPDCKHFSKAKGGKPVEKHIRDLAWTVVHWAKRAKPRVIALENVEEFQDWTILLEDGRPCPLTRGMEFRRWVAALRKLGYRVEWRELRACDYGAPTIRKRLFVVARRDRQPIVWPEPTHGPGRRPYRVAAECIDWAIPVRSIFERERPLAPATCRRIARGIYRYVLNCADPFIVPYYGGDERIHPVDEPLRTQTGENRFGICGPHIVPVTHAGDDRCQPIDEPLRTITTAQRREFSLISPLLAGCGGRASQSRERGVDEPMATQTSKADTVLVSPYFVPNYGERDGQEPRCRSVEEPMPTVVPTQNGAHLCAAFLAQHNHFAEVRAFLQTYYGTDQDTRLTEPLPTATTKDRFGLVTVAGQDYQIVDIGMRMLAPRELFRAQGFPDSYEIAPTFNGKPLTKTAQVRMCGNSVCPPLAEAIVRANVQLREVAPVDSPLGDLFAEVR